LGVQPSLRAAKFVQLLKPLKQSALKSAILDIHNWLAIANSSAQVRLEPMIVPPASADSDEGKIITAALSILVAEDHPVSSKVVCRMLTTLNHKVEAAWNGAEAVQKVGANKYDLVLMDMQMPEMDGLDASRVICARYPDTRPHICGLTANATPADRQRCLEAGMDWYLAKPINFKALKEVLRTCCMVRQEKGILTLPPIMGLRSAEQSN
jgi:CheY-like chemotaxis protein